MTKRKRIEKKKKKKTLLEAIECGLTKIPELRLFAMFLECEEQWRDAPAQKKKKKKNQQQQKHRD